MEASNDPDRVELKGEDSWICVEFQEYESVHIKAIRLGRLSPLQLLALAHLLEVRGKSALVEESSRAAANAIAIPGGRRLGP